MMYKCIRLNRRKDKEAFLEYAELYFISIRDYNQRVSNPNKRFEYLELCGDEEEIDLCINYVKYRGIDILEGFHDKREKN